MAALERVMAATRRIFDASGCGIMMIDDSSVLAAVAATDEEMWAARGRCWPPPRRGYGRFCSYFLHYRPHPVRSHDPRPALLSRPLTCAALQPGDLHLRATQLPRDLGLLEAALETQRQRPPFEVGHPSDPGRQ
jgi:hypothetical protein